jgi:hypothetical protein
MCDDELYRFETPRFKQTSEPASLVGCRAARYNWTDSLNEIAPAFRRTGSRSVATRPVLVIHERLGIWARQLRPRVVTWPTRLVETRSAADLESVLAQTACPLVVIDVGDRIRTALEDLHRVRLLSPNALVLTLDRKSRPGVAALARELGATLVLTGNVFPPAVVSILARWLPLARRRTEADGWSMTRDGSTEAWDSPSVLSGGVSSASPSIEK